MNEQYRYDVTQATELLVCVLSEAIFIAGLYRKQLSAFPELGRSVETMLDLLSNGQ